MVNNNLRQIGTSDSKEYNNNQMLYLSQWEGLSTQTRHSFPTTFPNTATIVILGGCPLQMLKYAPAATEIHTSSPHLRDRAASLTLTYNHRSGAT